MVTDGIQTYCGDHFAMYTNTESLCCTPEINISQVYVNLKLKRWQEMNILKLGERCEHAIKEAL